MHVQNGGQVEQPEMPSQGGGKAANITKSEPKLADLIELYDTAGGEEVLSRGLETLSTTETVPEGIQSTHETAAAVPSWCEKAQHRAANLIGETLGHLGLSRGNKAEKEAKALDKELEMLEGKEQKALEALQRGNITDPQVSGTLIELIRQKEADNRILSVSDKAILNDYNGAPDVLKACGIRKGEIGDRLSELRGESTRANLTMKKAEAQDSVEMHKESKERAADSLNEFKKEMEKSPGMKKDLWVQEELLRQEETSLKKAEGQLKNVDKEIARFENVEKAKTIAASPIVYMRNFFK